MAVSTAENVLRFHAVALDSVNHDTPGGVEFMSETPMSGPMSDKAAWRGFLRTPERTILASASCCHVKSEKRDFTISYSMDARRHDRKKNP